MPEALASRKVVWGDPYTEVSETANVCTDKQESYMRLNISDKVAHQTEVQRFLGILSRYGGDRQKDKRLTEGGLRLGSEFLYTEKSAEVIVVISNELIP